MSLLSSVSKVAAQRLRRIRSAGDVLTLAKLVLSFIFVRPYRSLRIRCAVKHVHGSTAASYGPRDIVVLCLVRNGEVYIREFIEHYLAKGATRMVFMDNGSNDRTIEIASSFNEVTVLRCTLPFGIYKNLLRRYLLYRFGQGRWSINVDIDEFFDFPCSDTLTLPDVVAYLETYRFTAVVAYMLDMFAATSLREGAEHTEDASLRDRYRHYELSHLQDLDYVMHESGRHNEVSNKAIPFKRGGVRKRVFDADVVITKHPLMYMDGRLRPVPPHEVRNARVADFTCALLHYKFSPSFEQSIGLALDERGYAGKSKQYEKYDSVLKEQPNLTLASDQSQALGDLNELIERGFLIVSDAYRAWAEDRRAATTPRTKAPA